MQAVGKIGSYISKSVYTVSGTFHPFGGAVDIIVVEQPDGSYKSSPWYVRFGKFQGVLKMKEKVVGISVNDVEADFHMHLDSKGEAFFMEDVEAEEGEFGASFPHSSGEEMEGKPRWLLKSKSCNYDPGLFEPVVAERKALTRANTHKSHFLGIFGGRSLTEEAVQGKENAHDVKVEGSLEVAEMAADLLDLRWSTNLGSPKCKRDDCEPLSDARTLTKVVKKSPLFDGSSHDEISLMKSNAEANGVNMECVTSEYTVSPSVDSVGDYTTLTKLEPVISALGLNKSDLQLSSMVSEATKSELDIDDCIARLNSLSDANFSVEENGRDNGCSFYSSVELEGSSKDQSRPFCHGECREVCIYSGDHLTVVHEEKMTVSGGTSYGASDSTLTECYSHLVSRHQSNDSLKDTVSTCVPMDEHTISGDKDKLVYDPHIERCTVPPSVGASTIAGEDLCLFGDMDGLRPAAKHLDHEGKEADLLLMIRVAGQGTESCDAKCCSISSLEQPEMNDYTNDVCLDPRMLSSMSNDVRVTEISNVQSDGPIRTARSLPSMGSVSNTLEVTDPSDFSNASLYSDVIVCTEKDDQSPGAQRTAGEPPKPGYPPRSVDTLLGTGGKGHFRRSTATKIPDVTFSSEKANDLDISNGPSDVESGTNETKVEGNKKKVKTLAPTSKQLASLQLKEGKNVVIFTFSTAMLGKQQVDARIFLWRWDTKIVISDVDGTITRSDLLGQVMPLVGMDWSQTGVAHLFTAIKENGYQLLFLSARSISQSYITRQFLLNIKQDGKALPDGPVVISPDGLFPSLFREVVRRAPHEFKIACLEDIRSLFPRDRNPYPFYAGFGNRDTDEFSYIKVGIPLGKIFIINPKGEIAVNRHVETKSYTSLHALVNGMFPNMFTSEQEDFNTWNFWKLSPPSVGN
ncbi:phosphatidate phosphatase [Salvia divinorum]|uniref:Phosphatidate phosphatase n=1 Tax=Salvia divinorum TaxID=28513 RepID=A0ABD1G8H7_SALDI